MPNMKYLGCFNRINKLTLETFCYFVPYNHLETLYKCF